MKKKPNILFIMSDQHRYDCMGYSGIYPVKTPHIDRIAAEGMHFSRAFTPIPLCCPARQCLINGRRPETFGVYWNYNGGGLPAPGLRPQEYAWPRRLKEAGYLNGHIGKWHVNPEYDPRSFGYDAYVNEWDYHKYREERFPGVKYKNGWFGEADPLPVEHSATHWLAGQAIKLMERYECDGAPWYLQLNFPEPHLPCRPAGEFASMYGTREIPVWQNFREEFTHKPYIQKQQLYSWGIENYSWNDWAPIVARYYGIISQMDQAIGMVLDTLERLGAAENTIVIYTSDHGDMCGAHRMIDKHYVLYDDVVRIPLAVRWPGKIKAGSVCEEFVYNVLDLPPTIFEILGFAPEEHFQGRSLLRLLEGLNVPDWRTEVVSTYNGQQFGLYTQRMLRDRRWKYIWNTTDVDELYDLERDPGELTNLIHEPEYGSLVAEMRRKLYETLLAEGDKLPANPWMKHQLLDGKKI
ncbi:MAG: sulfatase-like hydrolase/transferase [Bacillota bacterium]